MQNQEANEYRLVCHGAGQVGHHEHVFTYTDRDVAVKMLKKRTVEWGRNPTSKPCTPFHLEERVRTDWVPSTIGEDDDAET